MSTTALAGSLPPGPRTPASVQVARWTLDPATFLRDCRRRFGNLFTLRLVLGGRVPTVFLADPEYVGEVFRRKATTVGFPRETLTPIFGSNSVLVVDGPEHLRKRKLLAPPFHGQNLRQHEETVLDATTTAVEGWPVGEPFALGERLHSIALEVILKAVFGLDDPRRDALVRRRIDQLLSLGANRFTIAAAALPARVGPIDLRFPVVHRRRRLDAALHEEIARRRAEGDLAGRHDVMSTLLTARDETGDGLSDQEVCDNLVTILLAGHETTATALAWSFDHLLHNQAAFGRTVEEARDPAGSGEYAEAVITESLRMSPPFPIVTRALAAPLRAGGYELPAGTLVAPCSFLIHRSPEWFAPDPEAFRPERFLGSPVDRSSWFPFGGGERRCLGANFARVQARLIMCRVLQLVDLAPGAVRPETIRRKGLVLAPRRGTRAVVVRRL